MKVMIEGDAYMPERAHTTDAGLDIRSRETKGIMPGGSEIFHTGVHVQLPQGTAGILVSKSGLNTYHGITSTGLIDEGYTGEIVVKLYNHSNYHYVVEKGDKISQLVIVPVMYEGLELVAQLDDSERGSNGFGSSGK